MLLGIFLLLTVLIQLGVAIYLLNIGIEQIQNVEPPFCESPECLRSSAYIKESLNLNVDPCENFYDFVCGLKKPEEETENDQKLLGLLLFQRYRVLNYNPKRSKLLGELLSHINIDQSLKARDLKSM